MFLAQRYSFRAAFLVPALLGVLWAPLWFFLYRDPPPKERNAIHAVSLKELLSQSSAWAVMLCRFFIGPVMQFYWYWIPSYLYSVRHLSLTQIGIVGWIPFFSEIREVWLGAGLPACCTSAAWGRSMFAASLCTAAPSCARPVWQFPTGRVCPPRSC